MRRHLILKYLWHNILVWTGYEYHRTANILAKTDKLIAKLNNSNKVATNKATAAYRAFNYHSAEADRAARVAAKFEELL